jgi:hypothetical protein
VLNLRKEESELKRTIHIGIPIEYEATDNGLMQEETVDEI